MTNLAVQFTPPELVARNLFPVVPVENRADVYSVFDKSMFNTADDTRADGDESNEVSRGWRYEPYVCEKHALNEPITQDMRKNWDSQVDLESSTTEYLKQLVWNNYEIRMFGTGGICRTAANNIYSNALNWSNLTTASPRTDLEAAINAVEIGCGFTPNTIVLTPLVARWIMRTAEWKDENKYTVNIWKEGGAADLPPNMYGMNVIYVKSLINTARKGQPPALSRIMSDDIWLGYVNPSGPGYKSVTYGATLMEYEEVTSWFEKSRKADIYEYEANYTPKLIAKECGALLTDVTT
jgi:hypothetical protein